jgi:hypothetical protein
MNELGEPKRDDLHARNPWNVLADLDRAEDLLRGIDKDRRSIYVIISLGALVIFQAFMILFLWEDAPARLPIFSGIVLFIAFVASIVVYGTWSKIARDWDAIIRITSLIRESYGTLSRQGHFNDYERAMITYRLARMPIGAPESPPHIFSRRLRRHPAN